MPKMAYFARAKYKNVDFRSKIDINKQLSRITNISGDCAHPPCNPRAWVIVARLTFANARPFCDRATVAIETAAQRARQPTKEGIRHETWPLLEISPGGVKRGQNRSAPSQNGTDISPEQLKVGQSSSRADGLSSDPV